MSQIIVSEMGMSLLNFFFVKLKFNKQFLLEISFYALSHHHHVSRQKNSDVLASHNKLFHDAKLYLNRRLSGKS